MPTLQPNFVFPGYVGDVPLKSRESLNLVVNWLNSRGREWVKEEHFTFTPYYLVHFIDSATGWKITFAQGYKDSSRHSSGGVGVKIQGPQGIDYYCHDLTKAESKELFELLGQMH